MVNIESRIENSEKTEIREHRKVKDYRKGKRKW